MTKVVESWNGVRAYNKDTEVEHKNATYRARQYVNNPVIEPHAGDEVFWEKLDKAETKTEDKK